MVRVRAEAMITTNVPVRARARDQRQISRDCVLASELVQAETAPRKCVYQNNFADKT